MRRSATSSAPTTAAAAATTSPGDHLARTGDHRGAHCAAAAGGYTPGADPDADAAALAWSTVFDSSLGFDAKAAYLADADALRPTAEAYTSAGEAVGGIALVPTAVTITGDTAAIIYDVTFAGQIAYEDQDGSLDRVDGTWTVSATRLVLRLHVRRPPPLPGVIVGARRGSRFSCGIVTLSVTIRRGNRSTPSSPSPRRRSPGG